MSPELDGPLRGPGQLQSLLARCNFPAPGSPLVCAVSGGPDSLALLALATAAGCSVTAVHVDHGLRPDSAGEAEVVRAAAARFGARFRAERLSVPLGPNLEARARSARLGVLPDDAATGHTMDDQAETMLCNLLRGAGLDGLAAMEPGHRHPILALRRHETEAVCGSFGLEPVRDPTNRDPRYVRNRVRHELLPLCQSIAGRDVVPVLARQADLLRDEAAFLDASALEVIPDPTDARRLRQAPLVLARRAVRHWLTDGVGRTDRHPPSSAEVARVLEVAFGDRLAAQLAGGRRVRRSASRLNIEDRSPTEA